MENTRVATLNLVSRKGPSEHLKSEWQKIVTIEKNERKVYCGKREELEEIDLTWEELGTFKELRKVQYGRVAVDKEVRDGK